MSPSSGNTGAVPASGGTAPRQGGVHVMRIQLRRVVRVQVRLQAGGRRYEALRRRQEVVRHTAYV